MCKFSQLDYTRDSIGKLIKKLHITDEYPYEILGEYAGLSGSMMRQIADGNRGMRAENILMLMRRLLEEDGNGRLHKLSIPPGYSIVRIGEVQANGCPDDEVIDGGEALYMFRDGHKATNAEIMQKAIEYHDQVGDRMKAEHARMRGKS